ncbi:UDP-N-acetylmuramoyl-tripeptide--D-alanyl-D-alanine ligase [Latilactobacillus sakei]|uniref:UDP-N-acetylmuramoyl-tripeptide--D-alanyl-D-alanine ligase n=1 Tax=Latilactobacillus sakei TaxID=1599 RepID=A0AAF0K4N2_LATSK|nr:UDP-N-acetylmuramoyl-tripeptide--D-alanyl-D-alanine ligase [Latilactobacillus sakei]QMU87041.1 UDP-N-acetylmuramoyl-tripeptide--D-alanyl-D-alanine ligase [Latilactobacillus sakei]UNC19398.1 UDP-N-acetylmuramoyl-tripeptide--D-alanyl-D-alanine ligase [Latilactobacillus sakei]WEY50124.1 UDP-N-acetylmuramoyl-tripeptide--D-alanyl-D-alanine ligase [Latilactobacillus sakei]WGI18918.1 UDP-N-acetylmuramoyl-tripeptide--D-alanyl-D-alanine ligase [Latilactobacillus sakei]
MKMQLSEIARMTGAKNETEQWATVEVTSVAFDARELRPGALFVPLAGNRDGHDFINQARENGAVATLWASARDDQPTDFPVLLVKDPLAAYQQLAKRYLLKINPKVVAITGSNGKTTTKDMTAAVLGSQYNIHKTQANFNNEIGVPQTILSMEANTEILVIEMGMDRPGQLHALSEIAMPDVAAITMIGEAHIEFFKTRDKIADAKMEITDFLKEDGLLVYDGDEPLLNERVGDLERETFGSATTNTLYPIQVRAGETKTQFKLNAWPDVAFEIPMMGAYNVNNALAAILIGQHYHIKPEVMSKALANFEVTRNRTEWLVGTAGQRMLSDVYNSNPTAAIEVLRNFSHFETDGRRIAVLGDMLELGTASKKLHESLATVLDPAQIQEVYLFGTEIKPLFDKLAIIYPAEQLHYFEKTQQPELITALAETIQPSDLVVLKASHGLHLEKVVAALTTEND